MPFFTRPYLNDDQFQQILTDTLTLNGETNFAGVLKSKGIEIDASTGGTVSIGDVLTLDSDGIIRLKSSSSGNTNTYQGASPSTINVGGIPANTTLTGKTFEQLWEDLLVVYQAPSFNIFSNNISSLNQVGNPPQWDDTIPNDYTFTWSTTNSGNVSGSSISIIDTSNPVPPLGEGLANDGSENLSLGIPINNNVPISHTWQIEGKNTEGSFFTKNYTITSIYPWFYGTAPSGGASVGQNRPTADQTLINSGNAIVANSSGTVIVNNFNATSDDYLWFAIPSTSTLKTRWYVDALNQGDIGTPPVGDPEYKFPTPDVIFISSPNGYWNSVQYRVYISNKQDPATYMEFRNS